MGKLRGIRHKDRISAVQSSQSRGTEQCKKCVQYDFKFTSIYNRKEFLHYKPSKNVKM